MATLDPNTPQTPQAPPFQPAQGSGAVGQGQIYTSEGVTAPPMQAATAPPPQQSEVITPGGSSGFPKKLLVILGVVLVLGGIVFAVVKFLLPQVNKGGPIALTWWGLWEDESMVTPLISEYESQHSNVKITYVKQSKEDYRERLTSTLARGTGTGSAAPDIFMFHNSWVPMFKTDLDVIPSTVMTPEEYSQTFFPVASSDLRTQTGLVGIPLGMDTIALFVNTDIFATYGKTPPRTWDDLRQTAIDLTIRDQTGNITQAGVALGRTENVDHWQEILALMMIQNGVNLTTVTPADRAQIALSFFSLFSGVDRVWDETLPSSTVAFAAGKTAMYFGPSWRIFDIRQQNPNLHFSVSSVPQLPKDNASQPDVTYATYWAQGVWAKSPSKVAAWDFLKFLSSKESLQKFYQNAVAVRQFGEPYPRQDMASLLSSDQVVGAFESQLQNAQSWFLASRTFDGATGINSQMSKYFEDAIGSVNKGTSTEVVLTTLTSGVTQVLSNYGLATAPQITQP